MAYRGSLRSKRSKRTTNVLKCETSKSDEMSFSSSGSESGVSVGTTEVRDGFSAKKLLKENECFKKDSDHMYTRVDPQNRGMFGTMRKRKISEDSVEKPGKQKCFSKNAVMARLNRERKKKYISSLESENEFLHRQNTEMRQKIENQNKSIFGMRREILYLKGLLANSKELGQILKNLNGAAGLPVTSSMAQTAESRDQSSEVSTLTDEGISREEYQPRVRSVYSGSHFPILDKDINLGSCTEKLCGGCGDLECYPFDFENESYDIHSSFLANDDSFFNFNTNKLDLKELDELSEVQNSTKRDPNIGICLHVNQRRVSVEICSICNSQAGCALEEIPDKIF